MRFRSVTLEDIFSYKGIISFKFDNNGKPIFLIIGENGFGKTSFINSIKIGLHGITKDLLHIGTFSLSKQEFLLGSPTKNYSGILNREARRQGKNFCKIQIEIEDDELIKIERSFIIHKKSYVEKLAVYDLDDTLIAEDEEAQDIINSKISPNMQKFFFFDGEKIQTISDFTHSEFRQMLEDVLDLSIYDQSISDANFLIKKINKSELDDESIKKLNELEQEYINVLTDLEYFKNQLFLERDRLRDLEHERKRLERKINKQKGFYKERIEQKKEILLQKKDELKHKIDIFKNIAITYLPLLLNKNLYVKVYDDFNSNYKNRVPIPEEVLSIKKEQFVFELKKLRISNEMKNNLLKILSKVFIPQNEEMSVEFADPYKIEKQFNSFNFKFDLSKLLDDISKLKTHIKNLEFEICDLEKKSEELHRDLFDINLKLSNEIYKQIGIQEEKILSLTNKIDQLEKQLKYLKKEIGKYSIQEYKTSLAHKKIEILNAISDVMNFIKQKIKKEKRGQLEKAINEKFLMLKKENFEAQRIVLDEDFHINLLDKKGNLMDILSNSSGQKQIIATALIWGISEFISQEIPLIIDTPLGRLDDKNQALVLSKFYPNASNQVIILPTPSELKNPAFRLIKENIAQVFLLSNKDLATTVDSISIDEIYSRFTYKAIVES